TRGRCARSSRAVRAALRDTDTRAARWSTRTPIECASSALRRPNRECGSTWSGNARVPRIASGGPARRRQLPAGRTRAGPRRASERNASDRVGDREREDADVGIELEADVEGQIERQGVSERPVARRQLVE